MNKHLIIACTVQFVFIFGLISPISGYAQSSQSSFAIASDVLCYEKSLQGAADALLSSFENMPSVRVVIREHERLTGKKAKAIFSSNFEGQPTIIVNPEWVLEGSFILIVNTIKHELIHAWARWKGMSDSMPKGHGEIFLRKAIDVGLDPTGTLRSYPELRPIYDRLRRERKIPEWMKPLNCYEARENRIPQGAKPIIRRN